MAALLAFIPGPVKEAVLAALAAVIAIAGVYLYGKHAGHQAAIVSTLKAEAKAYGDRAHEDQTVDALDRVALCRQLGGLPEQCARLRGMAEDPGPARNGGLSRRP